MINILIFEELGRKNNKVTNLLINAMEKAVRQENISEKSQLKIIQQNLAVVYPNMTLSSGLTGFETERIQDKLTQDSIDAVYKNEAKSSSFDTQLWLPPVQEGFQSDYKMRTYFITYRTSVLFGTGSQTSWNLSSDVVASGVNDVQIENLLQPVVIKFKPTAPVSGNENITCVSWNQYLDGNRGGWSNDGCSYEGRDNEFIICHCRLVLLVQIPVRIRKKNN